MKQETEGFPELGRDWIVAVGEGLVADDPLVRSQAHGALRDKQAKEDFHAANGGIENGRDVSRFLTAEMREARDDRLFSGDSRRARADRLQQLLMVMGHQRLAEKLREAHKGFDDTASKGPKGRACWRRSRQSVSAGSGSIRIS